MNGFVIVVLGGLVGVELELYHPPLNDFWHLLLDFIVS